LQVKVLLQKGTFFMNLIFYTMNGVGVFAVLILLLIYFGIIALMIISMWKIFTKAGKEGWASIVPFYNLYVMVEISKKPTWWFGMMFVPFANFVFMIMIMNGISKSFGKSEGFTVGMIFLPYVFYPILAFGDAQYVDAQKQENKDLLDSF
jgi:hypothetical protein